MTGCAHEQAAQLELHRYKIEVRNVKIYVLNGQRYDSAIDALAAAKNGSAK